MSRQFLIADDAPAVRLMIEDALRQAGVHEKQIEKVEDGEEALSAYDELDPDVVFADLNMPGRGGREVVRYILTENPRTRVIVVTGLRPCDERVQDVKSVGAFEVLHKPVRSGDVQEVLRELEKERPGHGRVL